MSAAPTAMMRLLPGLLALLMLHWSAASLIPCALIAASGWAPGARSAVPVQPAILAAAAKTVAVKLRTFEKIGPPNPEQNLSAIASRAESAPTLAQFPVGRADPARGLFPVSAFYARAPPAA